MKHRWIVVGIALVAAVAFAISVQAGRWWSVGDVEIGPFGSKHCFEGDCRPAGLTWIGGSERWLRTGMGTWAGGLLSMIVLCVIAAGVAARRVPTLAARTGLVAIATTVIAGGAFIAQFPGVSGAGIDRGLVLFVVAVLLGAGAAVAVLRTDAPNG